MGRFGILALLVCFSLVVSSEEYEITSSTSLYHAMVDVPSAETIPLDLLYSSFQLTTQMREFRWDDAGVACLERAKSLVDWYSDNYAVSLSMGLLSCYGDEIRPRDPSSGALYHYFRHYFPVIVVDETIFALDPQFQDLPVPINDYMVDILPNGNNLVINQIVMEQMTAEEAKAWNQRVLKPCYLTVY